MIKLTRAQENVLYGKLCLIKGHTRIQLGCQTRTIKKLTSVGFALEKENDSYWNKDPIFYLNQSFEMEVKIFNRELLSSIWKDTIPSENSPYKINDYPPMWKTIEFPDGLVLFTRPSTVQVKGIGLGQWDEIRGMSYQFQLDGKWIGQGNVCEFEYFEEKVAPALQSDLDYLRRIAKQ